MSADGPDDEELIRRALVAAVEGPYFHDSEFHALFGLTRAEVRAVLETWPEPPAGEVRGYESGEHVQRTAVNNALNNLHGFPHGEADRLVEDLGVTRAQLKLVLSRWRGEPVGPTSEGYFDRMN